jgi:hypothetical protein
MAAMAQLPMTVNLHESGGNAEHRRLLPVISQ